MDKPGQISFRVKCGLCAVAWAFYVIGIGIVAGGFSPELILSPFYTAPALLLLMIGSDPITAVVAGWLFYIGLTVVAIRAKRFRVFAWSFAILSVSFLLNIVGCEGAKHSDWHM